MLNFASALVSGFFVLGAAAARVLLSSQGEQPFERDRRDHEFSHTLRRLSSLQRQPSAVNVGQVLLPSSLLMAEAYLNGAYLLPYQNLQNTVANNAPNPLRRANPIRRANPLRVAVVPQPQPLPQLSAFEARLNAIGFDSNQIPEEFIDPISFMIMNNPVKAATEILNSQGVVTQTMHRYDRTTYDNLNGICPENRLDFIEMQTDDELKSRIEAFVTQQESLHQQRQLQIMAVDARTSAEKRPTP
jgi:hypothetical protein